MRRTLTALAMAMLVLALGASAAFADGSQTTKPTAAQAAGIAKAWNGGKAVSKAKLKCLQIAISKNTPVWAGLAFNAKATGCEGMAFDGTAILWGSGKSWNLLMEGSAVDPRTCTAMASVLGTNAWVDLAGYAGGLGCENIA